MDLKKLERTACAEMIGPAWHILVTRYPALFAAEREAFSFQKSALNTESVDGTVKHVEYSRNLRRFADGRLRAVCYVQRVDTARSLLSVILLCRDESKGPRDWAKLRHAAQTPPMGPTATPDRCAAMSS